MKKGVCPDCAEEGDYSIKFLTKHSTNPNGHHLPPFIRICRRHHDKRHGMAAPKNINKKYQPGTKRCHMKKK
ncbi:MAG: hypothetical protein PHE43_04660 [Candidatus Nanoarchaeia archaeon]|nr:hypothetical protein [Candidatus Nanoarchaeia archaeon]